MIRNPIGCLAFAASLAACPAAAAPPDGSADALLDRWSTLQQARGGAASKEPLHLESAQSSSDLRGTLHGVVERPFAAVARELSERAGWCAVLILDPNVHRCAAPQGGAAGIEVAFGESDMPVAFSFAPVQRTDDYLRARLNADSGPFGTKDYIITFEATPLDDRRTLVRLTFSQRLGVAARLATLAYFNTVGRGKVGFTVVERDAAGQPVYVGDLRGGLERNLMRYYYAILAYFDALAAPPEQQPDRRLRTWLAYTQRHPLQLREDAGYFERKSPDVRRQAEG